MSREAFDVIVIGGGPAGISAAIWCSDLGLSTAIVEQQPQFGGQLLKIHGPILNYPGLELENGQELSGRFANHLNRFQLVQFVGDRVEAVDLTANSVRLAGGMSLRANAVVIATGVRRRKLNVPGEGEFDGRGILGSGVGEMDSVAGKSVLIVGGGDAALENANILAPVARDVTIVHRRGSFTARDEFVESLKHFQNVRIAFDSMVKEIRGAAAVESVVL
ncbi:MAG: NAD(P)/FAD-dependent oxidoreductase, partial [Pyrinomonadaceae bacterium]